MKIVINGSKGRMGQTLVACAAKLPDIKIVGLIDVGDSLESVLSQADVVVDFSSPKITLGLLELCAGAGKAAVIGTTGHSPDIQANIYKYVRRVETIPIVMASNFSIGVNMLFWLVRQTAELLGPEFDLEIVEMHHRMKKDAPSGTAKTLAEILTKARNLRFAEGMKSNQSYPRQRGEDAYLNHGRQGDTGARDCNEIGIHSLRGGDVAGDHTVIFAGDGERLELTHKATSREVFAKGALRAAQWVVKQAPGFYSMEQVLGLADMPKS